MEADCPICLDALKSPVLCPCPGRHSFCRRCLRGLRQFQCPVCRDTSDDVVYFMFKKSEPLTDRDRWRVDHMMDAAHNGHVQVLRALLKLRCNVDHEQEVELSSRTALQVASYSGKPKIVQLLLDWNATVNKIDTFGLTALHLASMSGNIEIVRQLLAAGAYKNKRSHNDETALHSACYEGHLELVKLLLAERADTNIMTLADETPLHAAATFPHSCEVVRYLIEDVGFSPGALDTGGNAALHIACLDGAVETVGYLFDYCLVQSYQVLNRKNRFSDTPLLLACGRNGHLEIVRRLVSERAAVNSTNNRGTSPLANASNCGHLEIVTHLLAHCGDIRALDKTGASPLHYASWSGYAQIVRSLLFHQANVDQCSFLGRAPLAHAISNGHIEVVEILLRARACPNRFSSQGSRGSGKLTPLQLAVTKKHTNLVSSLLAHRASVNKTDRYCPEAPLHLACRWSPVDIVEMLLERRANPRRKGAMGRSPLHYATLGYQLESSRRLIDAGVPVNQVDMDGMTALHHSVAQGFAEMVDILVHAKASVNKADGDGNSPLMLAVETGRAPARKGLASGRMRSLSILKALLEAKAQLNDRVSDLGQTPLICAASNNDLSMLKILVEAGASPSTRVLSAPSAQEVARLFGYKRIEKFLDRAANSSDRATNSSEGERPMGARKRQRKA